MDGFVFAPAVRLNTPMVVGISGPSGSGKTYTALELAMGLAGDGKVALIDTEGRRSLHYADQFQFDHLDMTAPYSPARFLGALQAAAKAGYAVIVVDSFSDEYVGEGGLVDMAAAEQERVHNTAAAWAKPKAQHKLVIRWLRQSRVHCIFCMRAEEKVRLEKVIQGGREQTVVVPIGWVSICEKNTMYEMGTSFMLTPDAPGVPKPIKLQAQHRDFFPLDKPVTRETGVKLREWCAGGAPAPELGPIVETWQSDIPDDVPFPPPDPEIMARLARGESPEKIQREQRERHTKKLEELAGEAAEKGVYGLRTYCDALSREERASIKKAVMDRYLPRARKVDEEYETAVNG